jgi:hypothetical protein
MSLRSFIVLCGILFIVVLAFPLATKNTNAFLLAPVSSPVSVPTTDYRVTRPPSITVERINQILARAHSPAAGLGQALYKLGIRYGIDPNFALAFFHHESAFGTTGVARVTLSLSNMRCVPEYRCLNENGGYAIFATWVQGFEAWFKLIRNLYVGEWGRVTVDQIIPVYAPSSDNNNVAAYISAVKHDVDTWSAP